MAFLSVRVELGQQAQQLQQSLAALFPKAPAFLNNHLTQEPCE